MRIPAQVWQRSSVGGCSPSDSTHGQNTMQLHDSAISPFKVQLSATSFLPLYFFNSGNARRPMGRQRQQHEGDPDHDQRRAGQVGDALAAPIFSRVITTPSAAIQI